LSIFYDGLSNDNTLHKTNVMSILKGLGRCSKKPISILVKIISVFPVVFAGFWVSGNLERIFGNKSRKYD